MTVIDPIFIAHLVIVTNICPTKLAFWNFSHRCLRYDRFTHWTYILLSLLIYCHYEGQGDITAENYLY